MHKRSTRTNCYEYFLSKLQNHWILSKCNHNITKLLQNDLAIDSKMCNMSSDLIYLCRLGWGSLLHSCLHALTTHQHTLLASSTYPSLIRPCGEKCLFKDIQIVGTWGDLQARGNPPTPRPHISARVHLVARVLQSLRYRQEGGLRGGIPIRPHHPLGHRLQQRLGFRP